VATLALFKKPQKAHKSAAKTKQPILALTPKIGH
jgi:hypothetical protein